MEPKTIVAANLSSHTIFAFPPIPSLLPGDGYIPTWLRMHLCKADSTKEIHQVGISAGLVPVAWFSRARPEGAVACLGGIRGKVGIVSLVRFSG
jgi:hypothetical protein